MIRSSFKSIVKKVLEDFIEKNKEWKDAQTDWDVRRVKEALEALDERADLGTLKKAGGKWLGIARSWIQWNFLNGSDVTWGSQDVLRGKDLTVFDVEHLAAIVAESAINEDRGTR
jgi:hypothetical protein